MDKRTLLYYIDKVEVNEGILIDQSTVKVFNEPEEKWLAKAHNGEEAFAILVQAYYPQARVDWGDLPALLEWYQQMTGE